MSEDLQRAADEKCKALQTAALRLLLAERNEFSDAAPEDDKWDARDVLAFAARDYVRAVNELPNRSLPAGWELDDAEALRVQVEQLTETQAWMRATIERNDRVIGVFVNHHQKHPLPEDVRKKVVAAMDNVHMDEVTD